MLKALIVDDEYLVVAGLINCVNWQTIGIETPIRAANGVEALAIMESQQIDILITDIAMTPMDGIALMSEVRRRGYDTEIIVLSCYNDFEYSRKALQNGACDYLFKPAMMPEEITRVVTKARDNLLHRRQNVEKMHSLELQALHGREAEIQQFLTELIDGKKMTRDEVKRRYEALKITIPFSGLMAIVLKTSVPTEAHEFNGDEFLLRYGICNSLDETAKNYSGVLVVRSQSEYVVLADERHERDGLSTKVVSIIRNIFKLKCSCGLSKTGFSLENLRVAYEQAYTMADRLFVLGLDKVGRFGEEISASSRENLMKQALDSLYEVDDRCYSEKIKSVFSRLRQEKQLDLAFLNEIAANMIVQLMKEAMLNRNALGYLYDKQGKIFSKLTTFTSIDQFERYIQQVANDVEEFLKTNCRNEIYKAKSYMAENLSNPNLTIDQVASHVNLSKNYFSGLFKKSTGQTFTAYLTELRVGRAAELYRKPGMKIYQIAEMVGYTDWRYLTKVFKRIKGKNLTDL